MSSKDRAYKPMVKSSGAKRESEGAIVPTRGGQHKPPGGKGPHFDHALREGKREGMALKANNPADKVQQLQTKLWAAAKQSPGRRFHALYDRIHRSDVLWEAWKRVRANKGAAGVDHQTIAAVEEYGVDRMISELQTTLHIGKYRPAPVLRRYIPKPDGGRRPLGIPTVKDRVAQQAAKLVLEPIFEADFAPFSYGYRPGKKALDAKETIRKSFMDGYAFALDVDIADFFGQIDHDLLMKLLADRISDRRVLKLVRKWLKAGVMEEGATRETETGTPQGGVISPLLANIYLNLLDQIWVQEGHGIMVRYADDLVVMCRNPKELQRAEEKLKFCLGVLMLEPNAGKTRKVDLRLGRQGFDFLGCHFHARVSGSLLEKGRRVYFLQRWPNQRAMNNVRRKIKQLTGSNRGGVKDIRVVINDLNPVLRGWSNYFRTGNAAIKFVQIDSYVRRRLIRMLVRKHGDRLRAKQMESWTQDWFRDLGLYRLRGTIRYPGAA